MDILDELHHRRRMRARSFACSLASVTGSGELFDTWMFELVCEIADEAMA